MSMHDQPPVNPSSRRPVETVRLPGRERCLERRPGPLEPPRRIDIDQRQSDSTRMRRGQLGDLEAIGARWSSKRSGNRRLPFETAGKAKVRRENVGGRERNRAGDRLEIELRSGAPLDQGPLTARRRAQGPSDV